MNDLTLRAIVPSERDAVLDLLDGWISRDFFGRYFRHDPTFRDDLCFVACDGDRLVSTLQVFTKYVRAGDTVLTVGGVGNVYTAPNYRRRAIAPSLLRLAIAAMERDRFDASLLFATRLELYGALGWRSHTRRLSFIEKGGSAPSDRYELDRFDPARDLGAVMAIYDAHCHHRSGTTVRDAAYWKGQLGYAGNPDEEFLLARSGDEIVAYARAASLYGFTVILEHGMRPGHEQALADLFARLHGESTQPGTLCQVATEPGLEQAFSARALTVRTVEDGFWMWRVIDRDRLAAKLGISPQATAADDFFASLMPPDRSVYWMADRF